MWSLTGRPVFILAVVLAAAAPLLAVWLWGRGRPPGRRGIRLARVAARTGLLWPASCWPCRRCSCG